uniref:Crp/Fnr family transcriptional regulator n=1 Tax=Gongylonema pulchrum TaxID=637853 RepID=A0A183DN00_9BILA
LFDHWMQRYVHFLDLQNGFGITEAACAVAFAITRQTFLGIIEQAQNSRKVVEQQLALALSVDR